VNTEHLLATIDAALADWATSPDAMRWVPDPPAPERSHVWPQWHMYARQVTTIDHLPGEPTLYDLITITPGVDGPRVEQSVTVAEVTHEVWMDGHDFHGFPWGTFEVDHAAGLVYQMVWDDDGGHDVRGPLVTDDWCDAPDRWWPGFLCHGGADGVVRHTYPCPKSLLRRRGFTDLRATSRYSTNAS
jgi:hypothetical protein